MKRIDALSIKSGPTQSGSGTTPPPQQDGIIQPPVGGEVVPVFGGEILSLILVSLMVIAGFILYKKSNIFLRLITRLGI